MENVSYNAMSEARALDIHVRIYFKAVNFSSRKVSYFILFPQWGGCPDRRSGLYEYILIEQSEY